VEEYARWAGRSFALPSGLVAAMVVMTYVAGGAHQVSPLMRHLVWAVAIAVVVAAFVVFAIGAVRMRRRWEVRETAERMDVLLPAVMIPASLACLADVVYFAVTRPLGSGTSVIALALMLAGINVLCYAMTRYNTLTGRLRLAMLTCFVLAGAVAVADLVLKTPNLGLLPGSLSSDVVGALVVANAAMMWYFRRKRKQTTDAT